MKREKVGVMETERNALDWCPSVFQKVKEWLTAETIPTEMDSN